MILQALTKYYEDLLKRGAIASPGWGLTSISYALCLNSDGKLVQIVPTMEEVTKGKKTVLRPQKMKLPMAIKKGSRVISNFLWENSSYLLGVDQKENSERTLKCFQNAAALHHAILDSVDTESAQVILKFFDTWRPEKALENEALASVYRKVTGAVNLVFYVNGNFAQNDEEIRKAWDRHQEKENTNAVRMQCLVTGKEDEILPIHASIKGVQGTQTSGAALVSFNKAAFWSYGHEQNFNAPVGKYASMAYTAALNYLLADENNMKIMGDTTVVCWADGAEPAYQQFTLAAAFGNTPKTGLSDNDLRSALNNIANGLPFENLELDPNRSFYILGLAPNGARLAVRFFYCNTFGVLMRNINDHYERLEMIRPAYEKFEILPLWALLQETVNPKSRDKSANSAMSGAVARAIFSGERYPASLLQAVMIRIRAERKITWGRASILKAYYLRNTNSDCPKEVLTVSLNEASTNPAYTLGRLFSIYEEVQQKANPGINATIRDRYFNSASAMPSSIFPILGNLYQKHLRKLGGADRIKYDERVCELKGILGEEYPARMTLAQQGAFDLGYYHQTQKRYTKKEEQ